MTLIRPPREPVVAQSPSGGTVGYLFGLLEAAAVPGTVLVPLLTELGMSAPAVRTMLSRMVGAGNLASERVGRIAVYRLAGPYAARFHRFRGGESRPRWEGRFQLVLYTIPEARRQHRDELRERAFRAGFGAARPGVLIGVSDPREWCGPWLSAEDSSVELGELACTLATARRLAERAWHLIAEQPTLTGFLADLTELEHRLAAEGRPDREAFRQQAGLWERWAAIVVQIPLLPPELVPDPWPVPELKRAVDAITAQLQPGALAYAHALVARAKGAELFESLPDARWSRPAGRAT
ncbi:PaaX family transcriptional regulator C-terminal domain-containing protein [uncultured Friedmanniella sp.]|uniref:PaaX family transcriptional regulator C-terminal domain-containing protein n=1 Tax=uncultured Friedmanniella sp. TaxID=335381 RepID=UPI0035CAB453